jgi:preprotein translocase subunit SecF
MIGFLESDKDVKSVMRLAVLIVILMAAFLEVVAGFSFIWCLLHDGTLIHATVSLAGVGLALATIALGAKAGQKIVENQ